MIRFRCNCGNLLEVPESEAGGAVQCPDCGVLRSIPALDELAAMEEDGTIRLGEDAWRERLAVRPSEFAGPYETPRAIRPTHDPETGERITDIDLADEPAFPPPRGVVAPISAEPVTRIEPPTLGYASPTTPSGRPQAVAAAADSTAPSVSQTASPSVFIPQQMPVGQSPSAPPAGRPPTLGYAHLRDYGRFVGEKVPIPMVIRPVHWYSIPMELLQPANALVVAIVFGLHLVLQFFGGLTAAGALPFALLGLLLWLVILAHYVNVIDETGPEGRDEMPGVLRNVSFSDDFAQPVWNLLLALIICFAPTAALARAMQLGNAADSATAVASLAAGAVGLCLFPAVLLTTATSGSAWNLAPHRVLGVIAAAPGKYALAILFLLLSLVTYAPAVLMGAILAIAPTGRFAAGAPLDLFLAAAIGYPTLFAAIYFSHAFAWLLGKVYQEHHSEFPWVLQRHVSTRTDEMKQRERSKAETLRAQHDAAATRASEQARARLASPPGVGPR